MHLKKDFFNWSERQDLNLRPLVPQTSTLPGCATPRTDCLKQRQAINYSGKRCAHEAQTVQDD
jgi:hypothetical protein